MFAGVGKGVSDVFASPAPEVTPETPPPAPESSFPEPANDNVAPLGEAADDNNPSGSSQPETSPYSEPPAAANDNQLPQGSTFSGHGSYDTVNGTTVVPQGTSVTVYAEQGATISDTLGGQIESGGDVSNVYSQTYSAGDVMPNYTLHPPDGLNIQSGPLGPPTTVSSPTNLSDLLQPNMGSTNWAACTYDPASPIANHMYDTDGVWDTKGSDDFTQWDQIKVYP